MSGPTVNDTIEHSAFGHLGGEWHALEFVHPRSPLMAALSDLPPMEIWDDGEGNLYRWKEGKTP